ncbi:hypothetical protein SLS60_007627 [Paraconiothyrium brasiliense]|uniref:Uncharacterized protein n=1 Tax=Paraconiothyrium brasiliense TaxID=300254 RepID=A0ABR3R629_9PLEO
MKHNFARHKKSKTHLKAIAAASANSPATNAPAGENVKVESSSVDASLAAIAPSVEDSAGGQSGPDVPTEATSSAKVSEPASPVSPGINAARKTTASKGGVSKSSASNNKPVRKSPSKSPKPVRKKSLDKKEFSVAEDEQILRGYFQQKEPKEIAKDMEGKSATAIWARIRLIAGLGDTRTKTETYFRILREFHNV